MFKYLALMILENPRGQNCDRKCKKKKKKENSKTEVNFFQMTEDEC